MATNFTDEELVVYLKQLQEELDNEKSPGGRQTKAAMMWKLLKRHNKL